MSIYFLSVPGKQQQSFSGLTRLQRRIIILSLRNGGTLGSLPKPLSKRPNPWLLLLVGDTRNGHPLEEGKVIFTHG